MKNNNKKENKDDKIAIICVRCNNLRNHIPNCDIKKCSFCGADVWVSPTSKEIKFDVIYCMECWRLDFNEKDDSIHFTRQSLDEFNGWHLKKRGYKMKEKDLIKILEEETGTKIIYN